MDRQHAPRQTSTRVWVPVGLALTLILSATAVVAERVSSLRERLEQAEQRSMVQSADMGRRLEGVRDELASIRNEIDTAVDHFEGSEELSLRLKSAEDHLGSMTQAIDAATTSLHELEETQASFAPDFERELQERDERLQKRYESLNELAEDARQAASESQQKIAELDRTLTEPDLQGMWRDLVGPVVQLAGEASVGSGVLLPSAQQPDGGYRTYVLTAWHVVRDIQGDPPDLEIPVPVQIYREDGTTRQEKAKLLNHDPKLDSALLEILTSDALEFGARLAPRSRLDQTRIFDPIVAVGCPLGNDPIPTRGEVATCQHHVDGETYWMINAPTYIGNSGGGIFDSRTHELMGIFSKIYTHGSLRPTIVPHMGLVTPMAKIYDWLAEVGHGDLVPNDVVIGEAAHSK